MKICPLEAEVFHTDGLTDLTKLIVPFRNFTNTPKITENKVNVFPLATWLHIVPLNLNLGTDGDMRSVGESVSYTPGEKKPWKSLDGLQKQSVQLLGRPNRCPGAIPTTHPSLLFFLWTVGICYFINM